MAANFLYHQIVIWLSSTGGQGGAPLRQFAPLGDFAPLKFGPKTIEKLA